jgi:hypothetical protein
MTRTCPVYITVLYKFCLEQFLTNLILYYNISINPQHHILPTLKFVRGQMTRCTHRPTKGQTRRQNSHALFLKKGPKRANFLGTTWPPPKKYPHGTAASNPCFIPFHKGTDPQKCFVTFLAHIYPHTRLPARPPGCLPARLAGCLPVLYIYGCTALVDLGHFFSF